VQVDATDGSTTSSRASSASSRGRVSVGAPPLLERPSRPVADRRQPDSARRRPPPISVSTSSSSPRLPLPVPGLARDPRRPSHR
jgi:hypothetical protein